MSGRNFMTTKVLKQRVAENNPTIQVLGEFVNWATKVKFKCKTCKCVWEVKPQDVSSGRRGCRDCGLQIKADKNRKPKAINKNIAKQRQISFDQFFIDRPNIENIGSKTVGKLYDQIHLQCKVCDNKWISCWQVLKSVKFGCPKCAAKDKVKHRILTDAEFKRRLKEITNDKTTLLGIWKGEGYSRKYKCDKGHIWEVAACVPHHVNINCMKCPRKCHSKLSIKWLNEMCIKFDIKDMMTAETGKEFIIPGTKYKADGYSPSNRIVFEFYGDVYHGNLDLFQPRDKCHPFSNKTAKQLYTETMQREKKIKSLGYTVISVWENDYLNYHY